MPLTDLSVNLTNKSFALDTVLQQAKVAAGSSDLSNVRIKFQQYDNYPSASDGCEFANIKITVNSAEPEMDVLGNQVVHFYSIVYTQRGRFHRVTVWVRKCENSAKVVALWLDL